MARSTSTLPSWSSSVVFPAEKIPNTLEVLLPKLKDVAHIWWQLGLELKQHPAPIDDIKTRPNRKTVQEKFDQMLQYWLNEGEDEYRTWGALAEAAHNSGYRALGDKVRRSKHYREHSKAEVGLQELSDLLKPLAPQWKTLSLYLGIDTWITDGIDDKLSSKDCLSKVLKKWITSSDKDKEPTLEVLCKALNSHSISKQDLALEILKDVEVLELLTVSEKETDKEAIKEQLKRYIANLRGENDAVIGDPEALDAVVPVETT